MEPKELPRLPLNVALLFPRSSLSVPQQPEAAAEGVSQAPGAAAGAAEQVSQCLKCLELRMEE